MKMHLHAANYKFILTSVLCFLIGFSSKAKTDSTLLLPDTVTIGVFDEAPFIVLDNTKNETFGLSMQMWDQVNHATQFYTKLKVYPSFKELRNGFENEEFDLSINPIPISPNWMDYVDYSQPYFIAQTTLLTSDENNWLRLFKTIFTWEYFSAISGLSVIMLITGFLMWIIERNGSSSHFHKKIKGVFDGFWWSAVTLTTVGYGDKVPKTAPGRVLGFAWMFISIVMASSLTAGITAILTQGSKIEEINTASDLIGKRVGVLARSPNESFLLKAGVSPTVFSSFEEGVNMLENDEIDYIIGDRLVLNRIKSTHQGYKRLVLLQRPLKIDYYCFVFHKDSPLKRVIDPEIIKIIQSPAWQATMDPD